MREFEILEDKGMLQKFQKRENPDLYPDPKDKEKIESQTNQDYKVVWYRITAKGRDFYERQYTGFGRSVFIITWCDKSIEWLKEFFIKEIKQNGYKPYFQEDNEPTGEISSEIRERIANCSFVVCDLTDVLVWGLLS